MEVNIKDLLELVKDYNVEELKIVKKAYLYSKDLHNNQKRQS